MSHKSTDIVVVKFDYQPADSQELVIHKGDRLTLIDDSQHWWRVMDARGNTGYVPSNYVKRSKQSLFSSLRNTLGRRKSRQDSNNISNGSGKHCSSVESLGLACSTPVANNHSSSSHVCTTLPPAASSGGNYSTSSLLDHESRSSANATNLPGVQLPSQASQSAFLVGSGNQRYTTPGDWSLSNSTHEGRSLHNNTSSSHLVLSGGGSGNHQHISLQSPPSKNQNGNRPLSSSSSNALTTGQLCQARFPYSANQSDELSMAKGDLIQVLEKSSDGWWRGLVLQSSATTPVKPRPSLIGWFPSNYVESVTSNQLPPSTATTLPPSDLGRVSSITNGRNSSSSQHPLSTSVHPITSTASSTHQLSQLPVSSSSVQPMPSQPPSAAKETVLTLYPFVRNQLEELSFEPNELLQVIEKPVDDPDWWRCRNSRGDSGLVPRNYVTPVADTSTNEQQEPDDYATQPPNTSSIPPPQSSHRGDGLRLAYAAQSPPHSACRPHLDRDWCWGAISRADCESMLGQLASPGEFVIRDSESHPGELTVTINAGVKVRNFKVHYDPANSVYHIGQKTFPSLDHLIDHYQSHPIFKNEVEKHYLTRPFVHPVARHLGNGDHHQPTSCQQARLACQQR